MTGLDPTTLEVAGPVMAKAMGLKWPEDRPEVIEYVNRYRLLLYTMYDKFKLFDNSFHCICVSEFPQICAGCPDTYQGFTLPNDVLSVEAVWSYGLPLTVRSRWREAHNGIGVFGSRVSAVEMAELFCTERDLQGTTRLKIFAEREEDADKVVFVDVMAKGNRQRRIAFKLVADGWAVSTVAVTKILGVSLPAGRVGAIKLAQADGYELSVYAPWETVPAYRRMKVAASKCPSTVVIQGVKKFQKIYFDHDIVEVGNDLIIEAAGRYFKYGETTVETKELQRAQYDKSDMADLMRGLIARHAGHAIQDNTPFRGNRVRRYDKTLAGYQKRK